MDNKQGTTVQKTILPQIDLTSDQKIWIGALLKAYLADEKPDNTKIQMKYRKELPRNFNFREIDDRLFHGNELNAFGIFCYDKNHELLNSLNKTLTYPKFDKSVEKTAIPLKFGHLFEKVFTTKCVL